MEILKLAGELLEIASKATPVILALGGVLAFYFREKIKARIARSLAVDIDSVRHQLSRELASHSAALQRELEAYKVGLIAEAERVKAAQDVRKALALKTAERRFAAVAALLDAHLGLDTDICSFVTWPQSPNPDENSEFFRRKRELHDCLGRYAKASDAAQVFISHELRGKVLAVRQGLLDVLKLRNAAIEPEVPDSHDAIKQVLRNSVILERELRALLAEFERA